MEKMHPLVSVVVPVYNMESVIGTTLLDIICQEAICPKIIAVDDGSAGRSAGIISSNLKDYPGRGRLVYLRRNLGASIARNAGIDAAKGKYVFFIDGDDRLSEKTLANLLALAENYGADVAFAGFRTCGPSLRGERLMPGKTLLPVPTTPERCFTAT
jgi:glycosyltransferase involved in cell wall biosynthesis